MAKIHIVYQKGTQNVIAFPTEELSKEAMRKQDGEYIAYLYDVSTDRETLCKFFNRDFSGLRQDRAIAYEAKAGRLREQK